MVIVRSIKELRHLHVRPKKTSRSSFLNLRRRISKKTRDWPASEVLIRTMRQNRYGSA